MKEPIQKDYLEELLKKVDDVDDYYVRKELRELINEMVFNIRYREKSIYYAQDYVKQCGDLISKGSFSGSAIYINVHSLSGANILKDIQIYGRFADETLYQMLKASLETLKERIEFEETFSLKIAKETYQKYSELLAKIDKAREKTEEIIENDKTNNK